MSMYDAWQESKQKCYEWLEWQRVHQTALWYRALWEESRRPRVRYLYRWGFTDTRQEVDKLLETVIGKALRPQVRSEEMFHPSILQTKFSQ